MKTAKKTHGIIAYCIIAVLIIAVASALWIISDKLGLAKSTQTQPSEVKKIILDAGHGGRDGGAVSVTGTPEKEINLQMTLTLASIMKAQGYDVILTRGSDTELTVPNSTQSRKMQDIKGRLNISEENPDVPFVSIHMNKFPKSKYWGLQIYYAKGNGSSVKLAEAVRKRVKASVQPDNEREAKPATSAIYLLSHIKSPSILIECGFLSNEEEARKLETEEYRRALCLSIYAGITDSKI